MKQEADAVENAAPIAVLLDRSSEWGLPAIPCIATVRSSTPTTWGARAGLVELGVTGSGLKH